MLVSGSQSAMLRPYTSGGWCRCTCSRAEAEASTESRLQDLAGIWQAHQGWDRVGQLDARRAQHSSPPRTAVLLAADPAARQHLGPQSRQPAAAARQAAPAECRGRRERQSGLRVLDSSQKLANVLSLASSVTPTELRLHRNPPSKAGNRPARESRKQCSPCKRSIRALRDHRIAPPGSNRAGSAAPLRPAQRTAPSQQLLQAMLRLRNPLVEVS